MKLVIVGAGSELHLVTRNATWTMCGYRADEHVLVAQNPDPTRPITRQTSCASCDEAARDVVQDAAVSA